MGNDEKGTTVATIDQRVSALFVERFHQEWVGTKQIADNPRQRWQTRKKYQEKWDSFTHDHHHLAACSDTTTGDVTGELAGGCANGTCDVWTEYTAEIVCPHGARSTFRYSSDLIPDMLRELISRDVEPTDNP